MLYTRREIGKLALTTVPAASLVENPLAALAQSGKRAGSDAVKEVAKRLDYCKAALAAT
jgi:hypothetical protein